MAPILECDICMAPLANAEQLWVHLAETHLTPPYRPYKCGFCRDTAFSRHYSLRGHYLSHHGQSDPNVSTAILSLILYRCPSTKTPCSDPHRTEPGGADNREADQLAGGEADRSGVRVRGDCHTLWHHHHHDSNASSQAGEWGEFCGRVIWSQQSHSLEQ